MRVELMYIMPDAEAFISKMAAICYDADPQDQNRLAKVVRLKHLSCLRFASAVFQVSDISRACSHQLVRHKHMDYLQESQRYVKQDGFEYVEPPKLTEEGRVLFQQHMAQCRQSYDDLIVLGVKKEDARFVLPNASTTKVNMVGNLQGWNDFINLRAHPAAQWEIRAVAEEIQRILIGECPTIFFRL